MAIDGHGSDGCEVCGAAVPLRKRGTGGCGDPQCDLVLAMRQRMQPGQYADYLRMQRRLIAQRRRQQAAHAELVARLKREDEATDRALMASLPDAEGATAVRIPRAELRLEPLPPERAAAYEDHLRERIAAATADGEDGGEEWDERKLGWDPAQHDAIFVQHPALRARSDALCTACRGSCCSRGADHAYLRVETMRAALRAEPGLDGEGLLARYLDRLPAESVAGSCINQTAQGCALPRALRSETCNAFYCGPLRTFIEAAEDSPDATGPVLAIVRDHGVWDRYADDQVDPVVAAILIDDDGARPLALPPLVADPDAVAAEGN